VLGLRLRMLTLECRMGFRVEWIRAWLFAVQGEKSMPIRTVKSCSHLQPKINFMTRG